MALQNMLKHYFQNWANFMFLYVYGPAFWRDSLSDIDDYWQEITKIELPKEIEKAYNEDNLEIVEQYIQKQLDVENKSF